MRKAQEVERFRPPHPGQFALIQVTHRITVKAERRVIDELVEEAREVRGKAGILFRVVEAASGSPEGVVAADP
jgi:hypothetical protein